jgi:hypothetical protein
MSTATRRCSALCPRLHYAHGQILLLKHLMRDAGVLPTVEKSKEVAEGGVGCLFSSCPASPEASPLQVCGQVLPLSLRQLVE